MTAIRVGIVGASMDWGWGTNAHLPALQALPEYRVTAVATSRRESADRTAREFGVPLAFTDAAELSGHPEVDLVAVCVRVSAHDELVRTALQAGKHVYCEWPLGRNPTEAADLADLARERAVRHCVGLQARSAPAVAHARKLIDDGYLGRITSASVHAAVPVYGPVIPSAAMAYIYDQTTGATFLDVPGGHTLDALRHLAGDIEKWTAVAATRQPRITLADTGETIANTAPDDISISAVLASGIVAGIHLQGGRTNGSCTSIALSGTEGDLLIRSATDPVIPLTQTDAGEHGRSPDDYDAVTSAPNIGVQIEGLGLWGAQGVGHRLEPIDVPVPSIGIPPGHPAYNVACAYRAFAADITGGTSLAPDFHDAVALHRLIDAIKASV